MSEADPVVQRIHTTADRLDAQFDRMIALLDAMLDRLDRQQAEQDVPLHQRGFGVMDEPPA